jgi:hypothetical protein
VRAKVWGWLVRWQAVPTCYVAELQVSRLIGPSVSHVTTEVRVTKFSPTSPNEHTRSTKTTDPTADNSLCGVGFTRRVNDQAYSLK